jgi:hypothetical protein
MTWRKALIDLNIKRILCFCNHSSNVLFDSDTIPNADFSHLGMKTLNCGPAVHVG